MPSLVFALVVATLAGIASFNSGYGPIGVLVAYSVAGQVAMLLYAGVSYLRDQIASRPHGAFPGEFY